MFRRKRTVARADPLGHLDPTVVPARHQHHVVAALEARRRWREVAGSMRDGAMQIRLAELGGQVDAGVLAVWNTVQRMVEVERVVGSLDLARVTDDLKRARRDPSADPAIVEALNARFVSVQRMMNSLDDADARLRLLDARLGAAVARAAELTLLGDGGPDAAAELGAVVTELGVLRDALDELG